MSGTKLEDSTTGRSATQKATNNAAWVMTAGSGSATVTSSSGNVANASAVATLPAVAAKTNNLSGMLITGAGATAAGVVTATITGLAGGTMSITVAVPAGATLGITPIYLDFNPPLPATAVNTAIVVTLPALGAGNTNASVSAWGYRI